MFRLPDHLAVEDRAEVPERRVGGQRMRRQRVDSVAGRNAVDTIHKIGNSVTATTQHAESVSARPGGACGI